MKTNNRFFEIKKVIADKPCDLCKWFQNLQILLNHMVHKILPWWTPIYVAEICWNVEIVHIQNYFCLINLCVGTYKSVQLHKKQSSKTPNPWRFIMDACQFSFMGCQVAIIPDKCTWNMLLALKLELLKSFNHTADASFFFFFFFRLSKKHRFKTYDKFKRHIWTLVMSGNRR